MSVRITFSVCAAITFLFSMAFISIPEFFTMNAFPTAEGNAVDVGVTMRYVLGGVIFSVSCILFQSRNIEGANNQRSVLFGAAVGFAAVCSMIIFVTFFRGVAASGPPIIATGLCSVLCFLARNKVR
ncbi:MAG TPA: hypothetical protein EYG35_03370 [Gammaproteobacteria bacterium]|nr:hypothetical protein [Gammaproteobacteria bacterium]